METLHVDGETFEKINFTEYPLEKGDYEYCNFLHCDFSNSDVSEIKFLDCNFTGCNLSMAKLKDATFRDAVFKDSKMLGLRFDHCYKYGVSFTFDNCILNESSFFKTKIKNTHFKNSQLQNVDFAECDLTGSVFDSCDFSGSIFFNTNAEKVDFRTSRYYSIDPSKNQIKKAKFSVSGLPGLLDTFDIEIDGNY